MPPTERWQDALSMAPRRSASLGEQLPVRAQIHTINGFSAHADQKELLAWRDSIAGKQMTVLVHGELGSMQAFAGKLTGKVLMPKLNDEIDL